METPYTTRTLQPPPQNGGRKPEIFHKDSEQAKRSILHGIAKDMESNDPKKNLHALAASKNSGALETKDGKFFGIENISAPIPGAKEEENLGAMIENGIISPSKNMEEMAQRHGLELPTAKKEKDPTLWQNSPDLLKLPDPTGPLENPVLRDLSGKLLEKHNAKDLEKSQAIQSLDKAFETILTPTEKKAVGLQEKTKSEPPPLPWLKKPEDSKSPEAKDPIALFNDAAKKLNTIPEKERGELLTNYIEEKLKKALGFKKEEPSNEKDEKSLASPLFKVTAKTTPQMQAFKAGIEFFQEASSNKPMGEKLMGMGKAATKVVISMAQAAGTKMALSAATGPAAPVTMAVMLLAITLKTVLEKTLNPVIKEFQGKESKEQAKEQPSDKKDKDPMDEAISKLFPGTENKNQLMMKTGSKALEKSFSLLKEDQGNEKAEAKAKKQQEFSPDLSTP